MSSIIPALPSSDFPLCKICDRGSLEPKKIFRMSGPVVAIGYIFLIPSVVGIVFSVFLFIYAASFAGRAAIRSTVTQEVDVTQPRIAGAIQDMRELGIAESKIHDVLTLAYQQFPPEIPLPDTTLGMGRRVVVEEAIDAVHDNWITENANAQRLHPQANLWVSSIETGFALVIGISSFVGGLLGWLLVMKKRVLKCSACGAVVNAS